MDDMHNTIEPLLDALGEADAVDAPDAAEQLTAALGDALDRTSPLQSRELGQPRQLDLAVDEAPADSEQTV